MGNKIKIWLQVLWSDTAYFFKKKPVAEAKEQVVDINKKESNNMGWISILQMILKLTPYIVAGVQQLHPNTPGTTKKQIAADLLNTAVSGATAVLSPQNAAIAQVIGGTASQIIDATVQANKVIGVPGFTPTVGNTVQLQAPVTQIPGSAPTP